MTDPSSRFFGPIVKEQMEIVSDNIVVSEVFDGCGHSLALEKPQELAECLRKLILS